MENDSERTASRDAVIREESSTAGDLLRAPAADDDMLPPDFLEDGGEPYKALYLHLPFCRKRCSYCDFVTEALPCDDPRVDEYVDRMVLAIRRAGRSGLLADIETIYLGGGTPSYVGMRRLSKIMYTLSTSLHLTPDVEFTMEANPDSLTPAMVKDIWALGVNRLSIGVQSLQDPVLRTLGRIHDADKARAAIEMARERFENVSVDIICGVPGQDPESYCKDLAEVVERGATHVSVYPLTVEEGTPLEQMIESGEVAETPQDDQALMMQMAASVLEPLGLERYEVASYARPGFACRHNQAYWMGRPYLGLGTASATMMQNGKLRIRVQDGRVQERLDRRQAVCEDIMLGMRMTRGVCDEQVREAAVLLPKLPATLFGLQQGNLVKHEEGRWMPTLGGWLLGNELFGAIYDLAPGEDE